MLLPLLAATEVPLDPDAPTGRQWLLDELAKPEYQAAKPNLVDRALAAIVDWLQSLQAPSGQGPGSAALVVLLVVVAVVVVIGLLVFGLPRLNQRRRSTGALFGDDDDRSARELRASSERAAAAGDWATAIAERFRAIARTLSDRTVLTVSPGTTAHGFAARAGASFPDRADELEASATVFDAVRYLGRPGDREGYERVRALDEQLEATRPTLQEVPA